MQHRVLLGRTVIANTMTILVALQQGLSQDLETACLKLAIVKVLGVQIFKGDHNILSF